jgi:hypothetical protein
MIGSALRVGVVALTLAAGTMVAQRTPELSAGPLTMPQTSPAAGKPTFINGTNYTLQGFAMYVEHEPMMLVQHVTTTRVRPDGVTQVSESEIRVYRDGAGRFRVEQTTTGNGRSIPGRVTIFDPVALISVAWFPRSTTAQLTYVAPRKKETAEDLQRRAEQRARSEAYWRDNPNSGGDEMLGTKTMLGEPVVGKRETRVFWPSNGDSGFKIVTENWMSHDLQIPLKTDIDDSRGSHIARVVTELHREEPDPALFAVPQGYKLVEQMRPF